MPLLVVAGVAFVAGGLAGGYLVTSTGRIVALAAAGTGAYYLIKKGG